MSFKIVSNVNIDEITFNILEFSLGEKLIVSVNFLDKKIIQKTSTYTFTYSNTVPSRYGYSSTFPFPYYLPDDVTVDLSSFSNKLFDIYIINGLILPSIKYYEKILTGYTDLLTLFLPTVTPTFTTNIKLDYYTSVNTFMSKNYLYINSNSYSIDGPTGSISQNITYVNMPYNIYTSTSNNYTGISGPSSVYVFPVDTTGLTGPTLEIPSGQRVTISI